MVVRARFPVSLVLTVSLIACGPPGTSSSTDPIPDPVVSQAAVLSRVDTVSAGVECPGGGKAVKSGLDANRDGTLQDSEVTATQLVCFEPARTLLVRTDPEPAGTHCADGGQAVRAGLDADGNGVLGEAEIERVSYICGTAVPAPEPSPVAVLTRRVAVAAGSVCANGGTRVEAGRDANGDGTLEDAEVEQSAVVCDPSPEPPPVVLEREVPAPYGVCPERGSQVQVGLDRDGDGALSPGEVLSTIDVCTDTYPTFTVVTAADLALVQRATRIAGNLIIRGSELVSVSVPAEVIDGSVVIEGNPQLKTVSLGVHLLGGGIRVQGDPLLETVSVSGIGAGSGSALKQIPGDLALVDVPALQSIIGLQEVDIVGGSITLRNTGLGTMPVTDALLFVGGSVVIEQNLSFLGWWISGPAPMLTVHGQVRLEANPSWDVDRLPFLERVGGRLTVTDDGVGHVTLLQASNLVRTGGIVLSGNRTLGDLGLLTLTAVDGDFIAIDNDELQLGIGINRIEKVKGSIQIERNANLTILGALLDVAEVGSMAVIADNPKLQFVWTSQLARATDVSILRNASLTSIGGNPGLTGYRPLVSVRSLDIEGNGALTELFLPGLTTADVLTVKDNAALPTCAAVALFRQLTTPASPVVTISGNAGDASSCP